MEEDLTKIREALSKTIPMFPTRVSTASTDNGSMLVGFTKEIGTDIQAFTVNLVKEEVEFLFNDFAKFLGKIT